MTDAAEHSAAYATADYTILIYRRRSYSCCSDILLTRITKVNTDERGCEPYPCFSAVQETRKTLTKDGTVTRVRGVTTCSIPRNTRLYPSDASVSGRPMQPYWVRLGSTRIEDMSLLQTDDRFRLCRLAANNISGLCTAFSRVFIVRDPCFLEEGIPCRACGTIYAFPLCHL